MGFICESLNNFHMLFTRNVSARYEIRAKKKKSRQPDYMHIFHLGTNRSTVPPTNSLLLNGGKMKSLMSASDPIKHDSQKWKLPLKGVTLQCKYCQYKPMTLIPFNAIFKKKQYVHSCGVHGHQNIMMHPVLTGTLMSTVRRIHLRRQWCLWHICTLKALWLMGWISRLSS